MSVGCWPVGWREDSRAGRLWECPNKLCEHTKLLCSDCLQPPSPSSSTLPPLQEEVLFQQLSEKYRIPFADAVNIGEDDTAVEGGERLAPTFPFCLDGMHLFSVGSGRT